MIVRLLGTQSMNLLKIVPLYLTDNHIKEYCDIHLIKASRVGDIHNE